MHLKKQYIRVATALLCLAGLTGCSAAAGTQAANVCILALAGITQVSVSYDEEAVTFLESDGDNLILKEYMTEQSSRYFARIDLQDDSLQISEGRKPLFQSGFSRRVEIYLPASYRQALTVSTSSGTIDFSTALELSSLRVDSTSGTVTLSHAAADSIHLSTTSGRLDLDSLQGEDIRLETTSGSVSCERLEGRVHYTTTNGNGTFRSVSGSGIFRSENSGRLEVIYDQLDGDLTLYNKNGSVDLKLPSNSAFSLAAISKNGVVSTAFQTGAAADSKAVHTVVGAFPSAAVMIETRNGDIQISQS